MAHIAERFITASDIITTVGERISTPLLILFIGILLGKVIRNIVFTIGKAVQIDKHGKNVFKYEAEYGDLLAGGVAAIIYTISVIWALVRAGIIVEALWVVLGLLGVFAVLSIFLAIRDLLPDYIAMFWVRKRYKPGNTVTVAGVTGKVEKVDWQDLRLQDKKRTLIVIPNRTVKKG